jgi:hypothetical protein
VLKEPALRAEMERAAEALSGRALVVLVIVFLITLCLPWPGLV